MRRTRSGPPSGTRGFAICTPRSRASGWRSPTGRPCGTTCSGQPCTWSTPSRSSVRPSTGPANLAGVTSLRRLPVIAAACLLAVAGCTGEPAPDPTSSPSATRTTGTALDIEMGLSEPVPEPLYPDYGNPSIDVLAYDLAFAWNPGANELTGTATITLRAVAPVTDVSLDFSSEYTVDSASLGGAPVQTSWDGDDLSVPSRLAPDERATIEVRYHGTPRPVPMPSTRGDFGEGVGLRVTGDGELWTMQE